MRTFGIRCCAFLSILTLMLGVSQFAQASTIQFGIRSGSAWNGGMDGPPLCGVPGSNRNGPRVPCVDANSVIITDGSAFPGAVDANGLASAIEWSGTIGSWNITVMGTGYDFLGLGRMALNFVVTAIGTPTDFLEIYFSQVGNPKNLGPSLFRMDLEGTAVYGTVGLGAGLCNANMTNFMTATSLGDSGPLGPGSFDFSWLRSPGKSIANGAPNYSLTERIRIRALGADAIYSGLAELEPVPEPTSLLLLGSGLGMIGIAAWKRRK